MAANVAVRLLRCLFAGFSHFCNSAREECIGTYIHTSVQVGVEGRYPDCTLYCSPYYISLSCPCLQSSFIFTVTCIPHFSFLQLCLFSHFSILRLFIVRLSDSPISLFQFPVSPRLWNRFSPRQPFIPSGDRSLQTRIYDGPLKQQTGETLTLQRSNPVTSGSSLLRSS